MTKREIQGAIERVESLRIAVSKVALATIDPLASKKLEEMIERDINPVLKTLEYVQSILDA